MRFARHRSHVADHLIDAMCVCATVTVSNVSGKVLFSDAPEGRPLANCASCGCDTFAQDCGLGIQICTKAGCNKGGIRAFMVDRVTYQVFKRGGVTMLQALVDHGNLVAVNGFGGESGSRLMCFLAVVEGKAVEGVGVDDGVVESLVACGGVK